MLVETVYGGFECVGLEFENNIFLFNPTEDFKCRVKTRGKRIYVFKTLPNITLKSFKNSTVFEPPDAKQEFKLTKTIENGIEISTYPNKRSYAVLIKRGKFRFLYIDSNYMGNVSNDLIADIVSDLKKFFVRRIDIAYLPIIPGENLSTKRTLLDLKPRRFAPLLPTNNVNLIEEFARKNIFEKTAILVYDGKCDRFRFNLI